jgi:hypothetical protein
MRLFEAAGFKRKAVKPRVIVGIRYELGAVIEVAELIRSIEGAELSRLLGEDWQRINREGLETWGQAIGRAVFRAGIEGMLVPSARVPGATNLVVFPKNLRKRSVQEVLEAGELDKWLKSRGP